jgi:hypothetical protein
LEGVVQSLRFAWIDGACTADGALLRLMRWTCWSDGQDAVEISSFKAANKFHPL